MTFFSFSLNSFAQELLLDELIKLHNTDFIEINDYLIKNGWKFSHSNKGNENEYDIVSWAYDKQPASIAKGWVILYSSNEEKENILHYQNSSNDTYRKIKDKISAYKMKIIDSGIENNKIYSVHAGTNYIVILSMESREEMQSVEYVENSIYLTSIMKKETYQLIQLSKFLESISSLSDDKSFIQDKKDNNKSESSSDELVHSGKNYLNNSNKFTDYYIIKRKTFSFAQIYEDARLIHESMKVQPDDYVYIIKKNGKMSYIWYRGNYGYISNSMFK